MATRVKTRVIDLKIINFDSQNPECSIVNLDNERFDVYDQKENHPKYLRFYTSLIGEDSPKTMDLPCNYIGEPTKSYRYDWLFGISCIHDKEKKIFWDWKSRLSDDSAIKLQLIFDSESGKGVLMESDIFVNILSANLLCLNPSKSTGSWFEKNRESIGKSLNSLANTASDYSKIASDVFSTANMLTNFVASDENGKNWYLYKFLDQEKKTFAVEWHINKKVLDQFGPMLQGTLVVTYHGSLDESQKIKLHIKPGLSFDKKHDMCYVSPYDDQKPGHYIEINPK
jgi:hypothetical protein